MVLNHVAKVYAHLVVYLVVGRTQLDLFLKDVADTVKLLRLLPVVKGAGHEDLVRCVRPVRKQLSQLWYFVCECKPVGEYVDWCFVNGMLVLAHCDAATVYRACA